MRKISISQTVFAGTQLSDADEDKVIGVWLYSILLECAQMEFN